MKSLAEMARRLLHDHNEGRAVGGVSRHRDAPDRLAEPVVPVCSLRIVDLGEVKARLADRWPTLADKVHATAQSVIQRHLLRGDVFDRHGEDGYLVLFATLGKAEAEFKGGVIAREIVERLLGEGEAAELNISAQTAAIPAAALMSGDLEAVVSRALETAADDPGPQDAPRPPPAADAPLVHSYSPVWDTLQMTLLHFRAHIPRTYGEFDDRAGEVQAHSADIALLRAVASDLQTLAGEGRRLPVSVEIEHSSLASNSRRTNLIQALAMVPPAARKLVTLEIGAPPDGFWTYGCKTFLEMIRPLGIGISARMRLDEPQAIPANGVLKSVAVDLSGMSRGEPASLRLMTAFGGLAKAQDYECAAYGLGSRAMVLGAMGAGFRYVAGRAVHADVPALSTALRFELLDLYGDVPGASAPT